MHSPIKQQLLQLAQAHISQKLQELSQLMQDLRDARADNTKSSMGDKYETGTAMLHLEMEKYSQQYKEGLESQAILDSIQLEHASIRVGVGSVVKTSMANYFISVFVGKLEVEGESYYAISLASPIGQALAGAQLGDKVSFRGKTIEIVSLV